MTTDYTLIVEKIVAANLDKFAQVKKRPLLLGWFVGKVMKETNGKANPMKIREILQAKLK